MEILGRAALNTSTFISSPDLKLDGGRNYAAQRELSCVAARSLRVVGYLEPELEDASSFNQLGPGIC